MFCVTVAKHGTCGYLWLAALRGGSELYSLPSSAERAVSTIEGSLRESSRDDFFVDWQGEIVSGDAPETGKGKAVNANTSGAAAACRAWL